MEEKKYASLRLSELSPEQRNRGFARWPQTIVFTDDSIIKGSNHFVASWVTALPRPVHGPHTHADDELLVFLSSNPDNIRNLGCEVEMCIGPEMERHVFTIGATPGGYWHFVNQPVSQTMQNGQARR